MQIEPIINARFKQFRQKHELESLPDGIAFERFVNYTILTLHQPDAFSSDDSLLDFVCVGGTSDMGIDGLAIKVNGIIVKSRSDLRDILKISKRIEVEFILIQSKFKRNFNKGELNNFVTGVRDFLSDDHNFPMNAKVKEHLKLKEFILSDDIIVMWESNPKVTLYYVALGKWNNEPDLVGLGTQFESDLSNLNVYDELSINFVDSEGIKNIYDSIQNTFTATIDTRHIMPLTDVDGVTNSCISIVYGSEFIKLISTENNVIRKSLFNDNVRDFQGSNPVNSEILSTISKTPEKFIILNNGITIVCDEFKQNNTKLSITNPQIVNGCQTSHVIHSALRSGKDVSKVPISIKFISTTNQEIVNEIVRGTNRQNIVLEEAFETTKKFHKDLEEVFNALSSEYGNIYYERRSKQYQHNPTIKQTEKVNLRVLTQYFVGMFINQPHQSHRHESLLLKLFRDGIFRKGHSLLPYFTTAYCFLKLERLLRSGKLPKSIKSYKAHILMMLREHVAGIRPSLFKEPSIDKHCRMVIETVRSEEDALKTFSEVASIFEKAMTKWINDLGKKRDGAKDVEAFTKHLTNEVRSSNGVQKERSSNASDEKLFSGKVIRTIRDRYGKQCGFISRSPENLFFHSADNPDLDFRRLKNRWVFYKIKKPIQSEKARAIEVKLIES